MNLVVQVGWKKKKVVWVGNRHQLHNGFLFVCQVHIEITVCTEGSSLTATCMQREHTLKFTHNSSYIILQQETRQMSKSCLLLELSITTNDWPLEGLQNHCGWILNVIVIFNLLVFSSACLNSLNTQHVFILMPWFMLYMLVQCDYK